MDDSRSEGHSFSIRRATDADHAAVLGVLDGANLETDADAIRDAIERDAVLVAEATDSATADPPLLAALVLDGTEITQIAVRRRRRGQGIGTALVREAASVSADETSALTAEFDAVVRPFYEAIGFEIEPAVEEGRFVGTLPSDERFDDVATGGE